MGTTLLKKSFGDLSRRKARTVFTILAILLGVAGLSMFAVIPLFDRAIFDDIEIYKSNHLECDVGEIHLNSTHLARLEELDNVEAVEAKYFFATRIYVGERRADALFIGVRDFHDQSVDIISRESGNAPDFMEVLTDTGNHRNDVYKGNMGHDVRAYDASGRVLNLSISGSGRNLVYSIATTDGLAVFYTNLETVHALANSSGFNSLNFLLERSSQAEGRATLAEVENYLVENTDFVAFTSLPDIREEGTWPGQENFSNIGQFFYVLTFITLFSSLFLISNTMHTIISEQRKEISQMKAVGATRFQVIKSYLTTSLIMGVMGSVLGTLAGIGIAYYMVRFLATNMLGLNPAFSIHLPTVIASLLVGITITLIATIPSLLKTLSITVREGMEGSGITANYGRSSFDRLLLKTRLLPGTARMGIRNIARKKGRSVTTIILVALAVGTLLAFTCFGYSLAVMASSEYKNLTCDILTNGQDGGGRTLTTEQIQHINEIEGVARVEPFILTSVKLSERDIFVFAYVHNTTAFNIERSMHGGRWFDRAEQEANEQVVVISKTLARIERVGLGDSISIRMATGTFDFRIIGTNSAQMMNGMSVYIPVNTMQHLLKWNATVSGFAISTTTGTHALIDRVSRDVEDTLLEHGYVVQSEIIYVMEEQNLKENQMLVNMMIGVGTLVVLITMIGLMGTLTMNVLERTKEIGMLRCLGSRASHIRRIFAVEGLTIGFIGGVLGIPAGFGVGKYLEHIIYTLFNIEVPLLFPARYTLISLGITIILSLIIIQLPLRRATNFKPGEALRYQ